LDAWTFQGIKKQIEAYILASANDRTAHPFARAEAFLSKTLFFVRRLRLSWIWAVENQGFERGIVARDQKNGGRFSSSQQLV
jgi:hypothetical protein